MTDPDDHPGPCVRAWSAGVEVDTVELAGELRAWAEYLHPHLTEVPT